MTTIIVTMPSWGNSYDYVLFNTFANWCIATLTFGFKNGPARCTNSDVFEPARFVRVLALVGAGFLTVSLPGLAGVADKAQSWCGCGLASGVAET